MGTAALVRALLAIVRKDLVIWWRTPAAIAGTIAPPLAFLLITFVAGAAVGRTPVALVVEDPGPQASRLATIVSDSPAFRVHRTSSGDAETMLDHLAVAAVITIPADFDARYVAHRPDPVEIRINNLNLDFTNDLRRSLPAAITAFYAAAPDDPIAVSVAETDLRAQDVALVQFMVVPNVILLVTVAGMLATGLAMAREFEDRTDKELLLAPLPGGVVLVGKLVAGWLTTLGVAGIVLAIAAATRLLRGSPGDWATVAGLVALYGLTACGLGAAAGAITRRFIATALVTINLALYLFFLSGGIAVASFLPDWLRATAHAIPTYYAVDGLDEVLFSHAAAGLGTDVLVLAVSAAVSLLLGTAAVLARPRR